jgi:hypothetical protein
MAQAGRFPHRYATHGDDTYGSGQGLLVPGGGLSQQARDALKTSTFRYGYGKPPKSSTPCYAPTTASPRTSAPSCDSAACMLPDSGPMNAQSHAPVAPPGPCLG